MSHLTEPLRCFQGHNDPSDEEGAEALAEPTEQLLKILFDVQTYRAALLAYDIDPNLMPLGKLSRRHVEQGLVLLTEVQASLEDATLSPERRAAALADASNRFNTLVPHSQPLLIDSKPALARKVRGARQQRYTLSPPRTKMSPRRARHPMWCAVGGGIRRKPVPAPVPATRDPSQLARGVAALTYC